MLVENKNVRQREEEGYRRWFLDDYFDVIVWYENEGGSLKGFQVCYAKKTGERAFTWQPTQVSSHFVQEGPKTAGGTGTGILRGHAGQIPDHVLERLRSTAGDLDQDLLELITGRIEEYNARFTSS